MFHAYASLSTASVSRECKIDILLSRFRRLQIEQKTEGGKYRIWSQGN